MRSTGTCTILRAAFVAESAYPVELDVEHADLSKFPEITRLDKLVELYRYKYFRRPVDMVIALGGKAPERVLACGQDLFGDIPVVVISSNPEYKLNEPKQFNITPFHAVCFQLKVTGYISGSRDVLATGAGEHLWPLQICLQASASRQTR